MALHALVLLYRAVLKQDFPALGKIERAKRPRHVPVVCTREEVSRVLAHLDSMPHLMASLLYGAGLRLMACVRLRVKDVAIAYHQITVHDGQGAHDRVTMLPQSGAPGLQRHPESVKLLHEADLLKAFGEVYLPYAFERQEPDAV